MTDVLALNPGFEFVSESAALLAVIERAALNPDVDMDKMERLLQMKERIDARSAEAAYNSALADMQTELPEIGERGCIKDRNGNIQSKYALWEDINRAIKPVLTKFGFALTFRLGQAGTDITVTGVLSHRAGHSEQTTMQLPSDNSGSKNAVQSIASSTSYGKRYTASALLNLTSGGEDDDGQRGGGAPLITETQAADLKAMVTELKADEKLFLIYMGVDSIANIPSSKFKDAVAALNKKRQRQ